MRPINWCKLDEDFVGNKKVRRLTRKFGAVAAGYWAYFIAYSYKESHYINNPNGVIDCSIKDLMDDMNDQHDRTALFDYMQQLGLITITSDEDWMVDPDAFVKIRVNNFAEFQFAKGSSTQRVAYSRSNKKDSNVTVMKRSVTLCNTNEIDSDDVVLDPILVDEAIESSNQPVEAKKNSYVTVMKRSVTQNRIEQNRKDTLGVFETWQTLFKTPRTKLSKKRITRIEWALKNYSKEEVWHCLQGYASDPWRHEQLTRHEIATLFRDEQRFEEGLHKYEKQRGSTTGNQTVDELKAMGY